MTRMPATSIENLIAAYDAWPGTAYDKGKLRALVLRVRVERLAAALPATTIAAPADSSCIRQRLMLSVGEPGLTTEDQKRRLRIVMAAVKTYNEVCDLLHGRNPEPTPPLGDVAAWATSVNDLEMEFARQTPREGSSL
ncbi:hypothetical protein ACNTMW_33400 [Planosporangium sp. 12N6]|uniref:hypothetical protein n=1 Tax=Planosporangium spinosum TaxID=3402278 RepID=UPI003CF70C22